MFEEGKKLARKAMTSGSKDDIIAEKIFDLLSNRGYSSKKGLRGRGEGDYHYRRFDPPREGLKPIEVKVSRLNKPCQQSSNLIGTLGNISKTLGPQRVKIEFDVVEKEGGTLGLRARKYPILRNVKNVSKYGMSLMSLSGMSKMSLKGAIIRHGCRKCRILDVK